MDKIVGIYRIINPKEKVYIGQSKDIEHRKVLYRDGNCKGQVKLYNSLNKYGYENHMFEIIEECSIEHLDIKEKEYKAIFVKKNGWKKALFLMLEDGKGGNKNSSTKIKMALSSAKIKRKVKVYDLTGNFIAEFESPTHANQILFPDTKENTGGIIASCFANPPKSHRNFIFQYSDNNKIEELLPIIQNNKKIKQLKVMQYDLNDNFIKEYNNSYMAEKEFKENNIKINSTDIRACCTGKQKTCCGFKWKYGESSLDLSKQSCTSEIEKNKVIVGELDKQLENESNIKNNPFNIIKKIVKEKYNGCILYNYNEDINIFIPEFNLGINIYNLKDLRNKSSKYMIQLHNKYLKLNIKLIQIYSDEIIKKYDIVKSRILNELKLVNNKVYARKCEIREIESPSIKNKFLNSNHIQGEDKSKIKLGLYYDNKLVSLMTFNHPRIAMGNKNTSIESNNDVWELLRFCSELNTNVIGGASKLFQYFVKTYNPSLIYSFADNRWSSPLKNVYNSIGFDYISSSNHGYYYTKNYSERLHRYNFNKLKLKQLGEDTDIKTEIQIMTEKGYHRIWDCGVTRYEFINLSYKHVI